MGLFLLATTFYLKDSSTQRHRECAKLLHTGILPKISFVGILVHSALISNKFLPVWSQNKSFASGKLFCKHLMLGALLPCPAPWTGLPWTYQYSTCCQYSKCNIHEHNCCCGLSVEKNLVQKSICEDEYCRNYLLGDTVKLVLQSQTYYKQQENQTKTEEKLD